ncbi:MAG: hypothetical protein NTW87_14855 [Planctomycetota bacterium]|nr:hypothetical protein [Planctomycetota bacterium]
MVRKSFAAAWVMVIGMALAGTLRAGSPTIEGCAVFPADNPWNQDISTLAVHSNSGNFINTILQGDSYLHADFGSNPDYGFPYTVVSGTQPKVPIQIVAYPDESDPGPYPVPLNAPIEVGSDHHVLVVDKDNGMLYEMYHAVASGSGWSCDAGAVFDLKSNALRPDGWTSCDQAGLPILPGLVRYDEVTTGVINHALRFTVHTTQAAYIHPATHRGDSDDPNAPPMGLRLRLKASYDTSGFTGQALVVLTALKKYGMFVADTGTDWFISGATDSRWDDTDLDQLKTVPGSAFEAVDTGPISNATSGGGGGNGGSGTVSTTDTDQDGFPDELETYLNTLPTDPSSMPLAAGFTTAALTFWKMNIRLNFVRGSADAISFQGSLPVQAGMSLLGQPLVVDAGGVLQTFTLSDKGAAKSGYDTFRLKARTSNGTVQYDATAGFTVKLNRGSFESRLSDEGLTPDATVKDAPRSVHVIILFAGNLYVGDASLGYSAVAGKNGKAK